ncbi:MAG: ATP-binding protein [Gammaproteobacteria bacterium]|nr:ATP-binding protein [Gammaproteobacteria bacterium]
MNDTGHKPDKPDWGQLLRLFKPGQGVAPPLLAGRETELGKLALFLDSLRANEAPPKDAVLFGPRGNGKTVLLGALEQACRGGKEIDVIALTPSQVETRADLAALLLYDNPGFMERLKPDSGGVDVSVFNIQWRSLGPAEQDEHTRRHLISLLRARCGHRPLLVTLDEAHTLDPDVGRVLLNASQLARRQGARFLLVLAGTPNLSDHLDRIDATFWDRSEIIGVGRLSAAATQEALVEPLAVHGITFDPEALAEVGAESQRYPYFIQCWGAALCAALAERRAARIDMAVVEAARPAFDSHRVRYFEKRRREMNDRGLLPAARVVAGRFREVDTVNESVLQDVLEDKLSLDSPDALESLGQLARLDFIWAPPGSDIAEPGIPSLMNYVLAKAPEPAEDVAGGAE